MIDKKRISGSSIGNYMVLIYSSQSLKWHAIKPTDRLGLDVRRNWHASDPRAGPFLEAYDLSKLNICSTMTTSDQRLKTAASLAVKDRRA